jgi:3D-(3,5/4)-trihydroxycyclohexane-1,2-dione acylhydrolase (decyclizing)
MSAISALQREQYGRDFRTSDRVAVDYAAVARAVSGVAAYEGGYSPAEPRAALERARTHPGLSVVHAPVYYGEHPLGRLGAYGRWNVGNWCAEVEARYHRQLP